LNPINLWFVLILLMMVAAVGFRIWRRPLAPVRLEKIGSREVAEMVRDFLGTATDGAFGFPTGFFRIDTDASTPTRFVAREAVIWSSKFLCELELRHQGRLSEKEKTAATTTCPGSKLADTERRP